MTPRTPRVDNYDARGLLLELTRVYRDGTLGSPSPFFPEPTHPDVVMKPEGEGPLGTQVFDLTFPSDYQPFFADGRDHYLAHSENMTAHARWWTSDRGRPTIVMIHGWGAGDRRPGGAVEVVDPASSACRPNIVRAGGSHRI